MSDQISEKMARKYYSAGTSGEWSELEDEFIANLKRKGLIKPSKLDEAREWFRDKREWEPSNKWGRGFQAGAGRAEEFFEAAISEILEERE